MEPVVLGQALPGGRRPLTGRSCLDLSRHIRDSDPKPRLIREVGLVLAGAQRRRRRPAGARHLVGGHVLGVVAGGEMAAGVLGELGLHLAADVGGPGATGMEAATGWGDRKSTRL